MISVLDLVGSPTIDEFFDNAPQHLAELQEIYRRHGFEAGYNRAIRDQIASIVLFTEQFLQSNPETTPENRRFVYQLVASLQRKFGQLVPAPKEPAISRRVG